MKAIIPIQHLELILFFLTKINVGNKSSFFFFFGMTKTPGLAKKIKILINKSNFIFIPVFGKIRFGRFRKSEK